MNTNHFSRFFNISFPLRSTAAVWAAGVGVFLSSGAAMANSEISLDFVRAISGGSKQVGGSASPVCLKDDSAWLIPTEKGLSLFAFDLEIDLNNAIDTLTGRANCRVVIPLSIPRGFFPKSLTLRTSTFIKKTNDSSARVSLNATLFGASIPVVHTIVNQPRSDAYSVEEMTSVTDFAHEPKLLKSLCETRAPAGILTINIALGAERSHSDKEVFVALFGDPARIDVEFGPLQSCGDVSSTSDKSSVKNH